MVSDVKHVDCREIQICSKQPGVGGHESTFSIAFLFVVFKISTWKDGISQVVFTELSVLLHLTFTACSSPLLDHHISVPYFMFSRAVLSFREAGCSPRLCGAQLLICIYSGSSTERSRGVRWLSHRLGVGQAAGCLQKLFSHPKPTCINYTEVLWHWDGVFIQWKFLRVWSRIKSSERCWLVQQPLCLARTLSWLIPQLFLTLKAACTPAFTLLFFLFHHHVCWIIPHCFQWLFFALKSFSPFLELLWVVFQHCWAVQCHSWSGEGEEEGAEKLCRCSCTGRWVQLAKLQRNWLKQQEHWGYAESWEGSQLGMSARLQQGIEREQIHKASWMKPTGSFTSRERYCLCWVRLLSAQMLCELLHCHYVGPLQRD